MNMRPSESLVEETPRASAAFDRGLALAGVGAWADAAAALEQALLEDPQHLKARNVLGKVYLRLGQPARAEECWRRVLAHHADNMTAQRCLKALQTRSFKSDSHSLAEASALFRLAVIGLGLLGLLLLYSIREEDRAFRRAIDARLQSLQRDVEKLKAMAPPAPDTVAAKPLDPGGDAGLEKAAE